GSHRGLPDTEPTTPPIGDVFRSDLTHSEQTHGVERAVGHAVRLEIERSTEVLQIFLEPKPSDLDQGVDGEGSDRNPYISLLHGLLEFSHREGTITLEVLSQYVHDRHQLLGSLFGPLDVTFQ